MSSWWICHLYWMAREYNVDCVWFEYQAESIIIVQSGYLMEIFYNETDFVAIYKSISLFHDLKYPFTIDKIHIRLR